jgi:16S rRNA (cytidine1402-2'-O)-methyltransferase
MPGTLFVVSTPIGNLEDITLRALRILREAALVAAEDTRRTAVLLQHYGISTPTLSLHDHNERARIPALIARLEAGESVALVSDAGTPLLSDPGFRVVRAAIQAGIAVVAIPGASAITAALASAGLPVEQFTFVGFPPPRVAERTRWLGGLRSIDHTLVIFESPHRLRSTLEGLREQLGDRWVVVSRELTKMHEEISRGWISDLLTSDLPTKGEFTILVSNQIHSPEIPRLGPESTDVLAEFCELTKHGGFSRRDAVATLAAKHKISRQSVYKALADGGNSGE